ncbi:MAG: hypothetical protein RLZZ15_240 [Verrucomicrobiota bacterium]
MLAPHTKVTWELGCGHGHFLTAYAAAHPERICVGIDLVRERIERAERKRVRSQLPNLHFVLAEAFDFLAELPTHVRFEDVFVLFPDPWPKVRHHKNRIMRRDFLAAVAQHALPDTRLCLRTDFTPYFEATRQLLASDPDWAEAEADNAWPFEHETVFQSRAAGYHSLVARRRAAP